MYILTMVLRTAHGLAAFLNRELLEKGVNTPPAEIMKAPETHDGTLGDLYEDWAKHVLLKPSAVERFHRDFVAYLNSNDPLFLVRFVRCLERRRDVKVDCGLRIRPTDNSPAWWIHHELFLGGYEQCESFTAFLEAVPCHMFDVPREEHINSAGWYVAHLFNAKDRRVDYRLWDRKELIRRAARNMHPCNYFYIPLTDGQHHGGDPTVLSFFYDKFRLLYQSVWQEFLNLVDGAPLQLPPGASQYRYTFSASPGARPKASATQGSVERGVDGCAVRYSHPRLCFKADLIEPLGMDEVFCVETKVGTFAMTKRQFYETFPGVLRSASYRQSRIYHYPKPPSRALQFRIKP